MRGMSLVKQCLNVWPSVSEGRLKKECLRVRVSDFGGFRCLKDKFGCPRVSGRVTKLGV